VSTYKDDLDMLCASEGFTALKAFAKAQWGPTAFNAKVALVIANSEHDPSVDVKRELLQLTAIQREVNLILSWPEAELKKIAERTEREKQEPSMMRGGR